LSPSLRLCFVFLFISFSPSILIRKYSNFAYIKSSVLFWNQILKSFGDISLFAYLGQLEVFSSLFVIFSLLEFIFLSSIHSLCCYHTLSEQS
jgi:hypothetical protein